MQHYTGTNPIKTLRVHLHPLLPSRISLLAESTVFTHCFATVVPFVQILCWTGKCFPFRTAKIFVIKIPLRHVDWKHLISLFTLTYSTFSFSLSLDNYSGFIPPSSCMHPGETHFAEATSPGSSFNSLQVPQTIPSEPLAWADLRMRNLLCSPGRFCIIKLLWSKAILALFHFLLSHYSNSRWQNLLGRFWGPELGPPGRKKIYSTVSLKTLLSNPKSRLATLTLLKRKEGKCRAFLLRHQDKHWRALLGS